MRIGVYRGMPWNAGGGFQYEMTMLDALGELAPTLDDEVVCLAGREDNLRGLAARGQLNYGGLPIQTLGEESYGQGPLEAYLNQPPPPPAPAPDPNALYVNAPQGQLFRKAGLDWLLQLQPNPVGFSSLVPFVMPIHDLQHRLQPEFPEVSADGQVAYRDYLYVNACRYATLIIVESEAGRDDVLNFYGHVIGEDRIRILHLYPPLRQNRQPTEEEKRRVRAKYNLPERYFFYPAQFWRHKNHHLIVEALRLIETHTGQKIPVVFAGTYTDRMRALNFKDVMDRAEALGVRDRILYLGYAPDEDMPALYGMCASLVMPTFFGPSNIPALEAWSYGRPAITSDIRGIREQMGDAALLVDPRSPVKLAEAMWTLWSNEAACQELAARGRRRLDSYRWQDFVGQLRAILEEASARVRERRFPAYPAVPGLTAP